MANEAFLINPVKRSAFGRFMKSKKVKRHTKRMHRKARKARKNPLGLNELMILNRPKRARGVKQIMAKKRHARKAAKVTRKVSHKKYHRLSLSSDHRISKRSRIAHKMRGMQINPFKLPAIMPIIGQVAGVGVGYYGVKLLPKYILPAAWQVGIAGTASKIGITVALSMAAKYVFKKPDLQRAILVGGLIAVATELIDPMLGLTAAAPATTAGYILPSNSMSGFQTLNGIGDGDEYEDSRR
jgi:hypothetical protein